jgi:cytochrome c biogenesis protein CcdA
MLLVVLAFLGGALTILSPCILPVLPFVFARANQSFTRSTLPLLAGMALTFAVIATLASVGGAWAVRVNTYGRALALLLLAVFGLALVSKRFADWIARPFVALGNRLMQSAGNEDRGTGVQSAILGVATGLLWAPCAGPILGLILTGAALNGPNAQTTLLLFAYALGAARPGRGGALCGGRDRLGLGYRIPHAPLRRQHQSHRASAARCGAPGECGERRSGPRHDRERRPDDGGERLERLAGRR